MENTEKSSAPAPSSSGAGGKEKIEKQARQLAYDTRYKVKQAMAAKSGSKLDPAAVRKAYAAQLGKSPAAPPVKARAKEMLLGEDLVDINKLASDNIASAMYKIFVEHHEKDADGNVIPHEVEEIEEDTGEKTYKVRVTDKKTGNSYVRNATRDKIRELRANPNISSVEMTEYGEPTKSEKHKGSNTAAVKSGKGDEVSGKDPRIDLKKEDYSWKNGFAELIEKKKSEDKKTVTGEGVNNAKLIKVFPDEKIKEDTENVTEVVGLVKKAVKLPGQVAQIPGKVAGNVAGAVLPGAVGNVVKGAAQLPGKIASAPGKVAAGLIPGGKKKVKEEYDNTKSPNQDAKVARLRSKLSKKGLDPETHPQVKEGVEQVDEVVGAAIGGLVGRNVLPGLLSKAAPAITRVAGEKVAGAVTGKVAGTALGAAAGEMLDPLKKKKKPLGAAAGGAVGGAVANLANSNELEGEVVEAKVDDRTAVFSDAKSAARDERSGYLVGKNTQRKSKHWGNRGVKTKGTPEADAKKKADKGEVGNYGPTGLGASYNPEGQELSENPIQKAWNWFVPPPSQSANPNVRSGKLKPGKLEQPGLDAMNTTAANINQPIKATSSAINTVKSVDPGKLGNTIGKAASKAALPVAAGLAAKAVVDKVTSKKGKNVKEDSDYGDGQEAPAPGTVCFDGGAALPATIKPIGDPRELATTINLIKNKWRAKGLKMSYEPEGDKIDEGLGTALGGAVGGVGGAAVTGAAVGSKDKSKKDKGRVKKALGAGIGAAVGRGVLPGPAGAALGGYVGGKLSNSHVPEGDVIDEAQTAYEKARKAAARRAADRNAARRRGEMGGRMERETYTNESGVEMHHKGYRATPMKSESYTVTNADKEGNTPAYQGLKAGKKNVKTGEPLYKASEHLKKNEEYETHKDMIKNILEHNEG
jgi:hypothetical protein